jgi:fermentation-respiration switch protein FrsA (DUF1100 family)
MSKLETISWMHQISPRPLLYIAAIHDLLPYDMHLAAFEKAREPKKLIKLNPGHLQSHKRENFEKALREQTDFLEGYL